MPASERLTLSEAADLVRVSQETLSELANSGRAPARKTGDGWIFPRDALETWLRGQRNPDSAALGLDAAASASPPAALYQKRFEGFGDAAFSDNHKRRLHRWTPWVAGFSGAFVAGVLDSVRRNGERLRVLDPFAGVGTTLVEAIRNGDDAIGFEINPYAALACKVKAQAFGYDVDRFAAAIYRFDSHVDERLRGEVPPHSVRPPSFKSRVPFFSPAVESQALTCLDYIREETSDWVKELFQLAFGSVMVSFSNYSYEPSLGTRAAAGKPNVDKADVLGVLKRKLWDMFEDVLFFQRELDESFGLRSATVYPASYMDNANVVSSQSVDAIITSPPYLNNYHYIRNTRPQLFWLGLVDEPSDLKSIERQSFGQFWQTVRAGPEVSLCVDIPHLAERIQTLRERYAEKGAYGGPGWANYAASYFNDCRRFCRITKPLMKSGGVVVVVLGNSILQGIEFQTDKLFAEIAEMEGFEIVDLYEVRTKRTGSSVLNSSVRVGAVSRPTRLYETAVELRAP